jgi:TANFOR domain-containing protein
MRFFNLYLTFLVLLCIVTANAQNYAVQSTVQLMPPYSVYLSDYATDGNEKLCVILIQHDLSRPVYQLRLVMTIELNGKVIMRTSRFFNPAPISLDPGVPTVISGAELAPYVDSRNIDFVGYSKDQYDKTKSLPEGSYQITFTAYDYRRQDQQVSNAGSSFYYLAKNEPPLVNYPACGTTIPLRSPQQIIFSWLPRNTSSPTSAQDTEYELTLYETRPVGRNPNDVVLSTQPVYRIRTDYTQLIYGPTEPMLLEGMVYVWRVQAIDRNGKDAFRNNGYSQVCTFTYGGGDPNFNIGAVKGLQAIGETAYRGKIWWEKGNFDAYKVFYKKSGAQWDWFSANVDTTSYKIFDLEPDTEYEVRVQGKKDVFLSPYTDIIKFRTKEKVVAQCGDAAAPLPEIGPPLKQALIGMTFTASDVRITITQIESLGGGWFKGYGQGVLSELLVATYNVKFDRLYIDENLEAGDGDIYVISKGVAAMVSEQLAAQKDRQKEKQQQANQAQWAGTDFYPEVVTFDYAINTITPDASGNLIITQTSGETVANTEVPAILAKAPDKAVIIQDKNGDQFVVQKKDGQTTVTKVEGGGLQPGGNTNVATSEAKLIAEILQRFSKQIASVITPVREPVFPKGAGPMAEIYNIPLLPSCMPEAQEQLKIIKAYADKTSANENKLNAFVAEVFKNESDKAAIQQIIKAAAIKDNQKFEDVLTAEQLLTLEGKLCSHTVNAAKKDFLDMWWRAPYWERAAKILKEQFEDQNLYDDVYLEYGENECKTVAILKLSEEASITTEVTFSSKQTPAQLWDILHDTYKVDFLVSRDVTLESFGEWFWNYMAVKDDQLYHGTSWEAKSLKFFADMLMAAPGTVEGWITGKHWRTDEELAMWEHVLGILDVIPSEAFAKAGITALVIKIGSKVIDVTKFTQPIKNFITTAYKSGLKLLIKSKDEIIIYAGASKQQIGRLLNGVLQDLYWKYGGERILAKLAGIKYLDANTKQVVDGTLEIIEESGEAGVRVVKASVKLANDIDNVLAKLKTKCKYVLDGTGEYSKVKGHHPVAKKAFEGDLVYDYKKAFSVSKDKIEEIAGIGAHNLITGQQNSLYSEFAKSGKKLTIEIMSEIEVKAMKNVGVPEDVATGWVVKALEDIKAQGVTEITNIPWNGLNK